MTDRQPLHPPPAQAAPQEGPSAAGSVSVVVPVHDAAASLEACLARVEQSLGGTAPGVQIVFVDDRSSDDTWPVLLRLAAARRDVLAVRLSRTFGRDAAITAGLQQADGDVIAVLDGPDDPVDLRAMLARLHGDVDVVRARPNGSPPRPGRLHRALVGDPPDVLLPRTSVLRRKVAQAYLALADNERDFRRELTWLGFAVAYEDTPVAAQPRRERVRLATLLQSTALLRWIVYLGFAVAAVGAIAACAFVLLYLTGSPPRGWTSLAVLILLLNGFLTICVGVTGLYVGKILGQVGRRPLYVVDERLHVPAPADAPERQQATAEPVR
jgi:hypothetical protein